MPDNGKTSIRISHATWQRLNARKEEPGMSYDDVIQDLLEQAGTSIAES